MSDASDFFATGGGGAGLIPALKPKRVLQSRLVGQPEGFNGDGDTLQLPQSVGGGDINYRNNAGVSQWSVTPANINANCTAFMSFNLDSVDNLLWVLAMDDINNVLYLATVNNAGTIVNVGNASTSANITDETHGWIGSTSSRKGANMVRATQGTGNFIIRAQNLEFEINYTNGAIVSETNKVTYFAGNFVSDQGIHFNVGNINITGTSSTGDTVNLIVRKPATFNSGNTLVGGSIYSPMGEIGLPRVNSTMASHTWLQWKGDFLLVPAGTTYEETPVLFTQAELNKFTNQLAKNFGLL